MINKKEIEHLASLARIKLSEKEKTTLVKDFDGILGYIDQLKKFDTKNNKNDFISGGTANINVMRQDVVESISKDDRERLLHEAPHKEGDFVAVKKIIEQD